MLSLAHELLLAAFHLLPFQLEPGSVRLEFLDGVLGEFLGKGVVSLGGLQLLLQARHLGLGVGGGSFGLVERHGELLALPGSLGGGYAGRVQFLAMFLGVRLDALQRLIPLPHHVVPRRLHGLRASLGRLESRGE